MSSPKLTTTTTTNYGTIPTNYGTIPTTTPSSTTSYTPQDSTATPYTTFITRATHQTRTLLSYRRPWKDFLSITSLSLPFSYTEAMSRLRRNLNYFRFNYTLIILIILFLSLLWHPISMIIFLAIFLLWLFLYFSRDQPFVIFHKTIDDRFVLLTLSLVTILGLVFTHVGLNVLISLAVGFLLVGIHAAFRGVDDLFLDEDDMGDSGGDAGLVSVVEGQPLRPTFARVV